MVPLKTAGAAGYVKIFSGSRWAEGQAKMKIYSVTVPKTVKESDDKLPEGMLRLEKRL